MTQLVNREMPSYLIHAYLDGELDPVNALALETQLAADPRLVAEFARLEALQHAIREHFPREAPPPGLRASVEAATGMRRRRAQPSWRLLAASIAVTAVVAGGATSMMLASAPTESVRQAVVAGHIRALMAPKPFDVASSDKHTVKPWFNGKLPDSPRVVDLGASGFPLLGARLDVVGETAVPTLVYGDRKHLISLTTVPVSAGQVLAPVHSAAGGYNITRWIENGDCYWVVSDAAPADLDRFAGLFRAADAEP